MTMSDLTSQNPAMGWLSTAAPIAGAAVGAVGDVAGGLFSANQARKNRKFQERMYNKQVEDNRKNWEMVNEFNHPSAVLARMREAGLNPLLMYGEGGNSLTAQSTPHGGTPGQGAMASAHNSTNFGQAFYQAALMQAQIRNMNADSEQKETSAETNRQQAQSIEQDVLLKRLTKDINVAIRYGDYDFLKNNTDLIRQEYFNAANIGTQTVLTMMQARDMEIRRFHWDKKVQGEQLLQAWRGLEIGEMQASASMKQAAAAMMQAYNAAQLVPYQIGVLSENAGLLAQQAKTEQSLRPGKVAQQKWQNFNYVFDALTKGANLQKTQVETLKMRLETVKSAMGVDSYLGGVLAPFTMPIGFPKNGSLYQQLQEQFNKSY